MNVNLTSDLEDMVRHKVASEGYASASEVVREALRLMNEQDQVLTLQKKEIRRKITAGMDSLRAGRGIDGEAYFDRLDAELDEIERREVK